MEMVVKGWKVEMWQGCYDDVLEWFIRGCGKRFVADAKVTGCWLLRYG